MTYLLYFNNFNDYKVVKLTDNISIGRSIKNDIILKHARISRFHANIKKDENGDYYLYDVSTHGTWVNEKKIKKVILEDKLEFRIENINFVFINEDESVIKNDYIEDYEPETVYTSNNQGQNIQILSDNNDIFIIQNKKMIELFDLIKNIAPSNFPVLILGEPGTGKDFIARCLHNYSKKFGKYIPINCANMQENLFESEMFGCKKGAFTHATQDKSGFLKEAVDGTIFLDEIGDLSIQLQPKLLRFLQTKEFYPVGSSKIEKSNARVVSATNRNLEKMQQENRFRKDLFDRISGIKLEVPPLRERKNEIVPLANHFIKKYSHEFPCWKIPSLSKTAIEELFNYNWPGNIRELERVIISLIIQVRGKPIYREDIQKLAEFSNTKNKNIVPSIRDMEHDQIVSALKLCNNNKVNAAKHLGISRATIYRKIKEYNIFL